MVNLLIVIDDNVWASVLNRKGLEVKTSEAVEYLLSDFIISVYPREKELGMKVLIDKHRCSVTREKFAKMIEEAKTISKDAPINWSGSK